MDLRIETNPVRKAALDLLRKENKMYGNKDRNVQSVRKDEGFTTILDDFNGPPFTRESLNEALGSVYKSEDTYSEVTAEHVNDLMYEIGLLREALTKLLAVTTSDSSENVCKLSAVKTAQSVLDMRKNSVDKSKPVNCSTVSELVKVLNQFTDETVVMSFEPPFTGIRLIPQEDGKLMIIPPIN